jgi:tetratricopeptide (TPR) repeat protein
VESRRLSWIGDSAERLEQARSLVAADKPLEALRLLERAPAADLAAAARRKELPALVRGRAEDLLFRGERAQGERLLKELLRRDPRDAETVFLLGMGRRFAGRPLDAAKLFARAAELDPASARRRLYQVEALMRGGRTSAAMAVLRAAVRECPAPKAGDVEGLIQRYRLAVAALEFGLAEKVGERLLDLRPRDGRVATALAWPVFHEHFELFLRPAPYRAANAAALNALARSKPRALWPAYFRVLTLSPRDYEERRRVADYALVRGAKAGRYGWMRWEAAQRAGPGEHRLDDPKALAADRAAAAAAGFTPAVAGEPRRL